MRRFPLTRAASLQRASPDEAATTIRRQLPGVWLASLKVFPATQAVAYRLLPPALHLPFLNLVGLLFGVYVNASRSLPPSARGPGRAGRPAVDVSAPAHERTADKREREASEGETEDPSWA